MSSEGKQHFQNRALMKSMCTAARSHYSPLGYLDPGGGGGVGVGQTSCHEQGAYNAKGSTVLQVLCSILQPPRNKRFKLVHKAQSKDAKQV